MDDGRAASPSRGRMSVGRARVVVAGLAWLLVVAGASLVTWRVIDAAGRDVVDVSAETSSPRVVPSSDAPTAEPTTASPTTRDAGPSPRPRVATWQGVAGTVAVRCRGPVASLAAATPADGWGVEVADGGPDRVEVELRREDPDGRARVRAECVRGIPGFSVDTAIDSTGDTGDSGDSGDSVTETPDVSPGSDSSTTQVPPSGSGSDDSGTSGGDDRGRDGGAKDTSSDR
jgi:hypothetical protein